MTAATVWSAGASLTSGDIVASTSGANGMFFRVTQSGTTGSSEPEWSKEIGTVIYDNNVRYLSFSATFSDLQPINPSAIIELFTLTLNHELHYEAWENNRSYKLGDIVRSANTNKTIVFITHDFQEALRLADRMAIMRDGMIVQIGRPVDLILNPVDDYVKEFTTDVPWESVLCASDICQKTSGSLKGLGRVSADTQIDSLLGYLAKNKNGVAVEAEDGSVIGIATATGVLEAVSYTHLTLPTKA